MGMPPKETFDRENLKFGIKFSVLVPITSGLVGVYSQPDAWWTLVHKQKRYSAHIDPPEVIVHCKLTQAHMPHGSTIDNDTVFGVICQLPLLREEFRIAKLTFDSDLRHRAASRRALPRTSSCYINCERPVYFLLSLAILACRRFMQVYCVFCTVGIMFNV